MARLLVVVDYQNDFVDGALGFEGAKAIEQVIIEKMESYRQAGDEIVFTLDTHTDDYLSTQEGANLPIIHCVEGSEGWRIRSGVEAHKRPTDKCFSKPCFGSAELFSHLQSQRYESIELCGLVSHICVLSNAILAKTAAPETPVIVDADATVSFSTELHDAALKVMQGVQIVVTNYNPI